VKIVLRTAAAVFLACAVMLIGGASASARASYAVTSGPYRAVASFVVTYSGSGSNHTVYHSEPPNRGGNPDTNDAKDSGTQKWSETFSSLLVVRRCGKPKHGKDRCAAIRPLFGARGKTTVSGRAKHRHLDGLFPDQNRSISCSLRVSTGRKAYLHVILFLRYQPRAGSVALVMLDPVEDALNILPGQCPSQGDSIDGLSDNYFTPGFSFDSRYGPSRWFKSRVVVIPVGVLHRTKRMKIKLSNTSFGTPPKHCAVQNPSYERCITGGSWRGTLTFTRR
jgi:hypothetical protein